MAYQTASSLQVVEPLAALVDVTLEFRTSQGKVRACDRVNLAVGRGQSLGLVGESGSGKSTVIRLIQRLIRPGRGRILWQGREITRLSERQLKPYRRHMGFVAQDPYGSLFPNRTVTGNVLEPLILHRWENALARKARAEELLARVGIPPAYYAVFPHELSGGQQQRVAIARALALSPHLLLLDEAVSSLDVSIQAQIINLLQDLKDDLELTYLFVSHNLAVIRLLCERVAVMYLGKIVEVSDTQELFMRPRHPYTEMLIHSIPSFHDSGVSALPDYPRPASAGAGGLSPSCPFEPRCPRAVTRCRQEPPGLRQLSDGSQVACHRVEE